MIVFDVNVVLALFVTDHSHHLRAQRWFTDVQRGDETFGVPQIVWHSVVRLATNRRANDPPASIASVFDFIDVFRRYAGYRTVDPGRRHLDILRATCVAGAATADLVPDAATAAIAIEHGATVASFDRDFARFPDLRWIVPGE